MKINALVVVSDLHAGCRMALCPPNGAALDDGGVYQPSKVQRKLYRIWQHFWDVWVPNVTHGAPYAVCVNGDCLDGNHHNSTTQISHNLEDQADIAYELLAPVVERCQGCFFMVRGTEAHVGQSGVNEEALAKRLKAIPDAEGRHARYELWIRVGKGLVHAMHHIGTTGSQAYESTAVMKELIESYAEAGRWHNEPPDCIVRSHRHRNLEIRIPTALGYGISFCTAGWQLKTPFVYRLPGGRVTTPQIGGSVIVQGDEDFYTRHFIAPIKRPRTVEAVGKEPQ